MTFYFEVFGIFRLTYVWECVLSALIIHSNFSIKSLCVGYRKNILKSISANKTKTKNIIEFPVISMRQQRKNSETMASNREKIWETREITKLTSSTNMRTGFNRNTNN